MTTQQKEENTTKPKEEIVYKFSNKGQGQLKEAAIVAGNPCFIKLHVDKDKGKCFIQWEPKIESITLNLRPPLREEYPYEPYEFSTVEEPQKYLQLAMNETPDSLLAKIKTLVKQFNDISDKTATLLSANIFGSYFQDRFSTVHYLIIVGANGTGKSAFGDTFECLGYRAVNVTNAKESFYFRIFGTIEYGQVTIIVEEFDRMDENSEVMAMIKQGYQPNVKVPRMNNDLTKMEFYFPFGFKILIAEKSPNEDKARGVLDRSFKNMTYKGTPKYNIKEIRNPQGNPERQRRLDEMNHLRKLLLAYRLLHIKDPYKEIETGLDGRDEELCKPLLQLFYTLGASEDTRTELEATLQYFLDTKNNRKGDSLEGSIYPIVVEAIKLLGQVYVTLESDEPKRQKSISTTELWEKITSSLDGNFDQDKDGTIRQPNTYYSDEFGRLYRSRVTGIIRDKFGAEKDHKMKGNNLIFDLDRLDKMKRIYENDGKIKTKPKADLDDSLTHSNHTQGVGGISESSINNEPEHKNEVKQDDSLDTVPIVSDLSESVSHQTDKDKKKCPHCDYEAHPFFLKIHIKMAHEGGL
jgi:hypothetical protein